VNKRGVFISFFSIVFSMMFLVVSSATMAETQGKAEEELVSELNSDDPGLPGQKDAPGQDRDRRIDPLRKVFVPLNDGLDAFLDFTPKPYQGLTTKESRRDYRAVFGFHFRL
jgi:hypothetical protein